MPQSQRATRIYVDADACRVKDEVYRVAARHRLPVTVVAIGLIRVPVDPLRGAPAGGLQPTPEDCQYGRGASCGAKEHGEEK